VFLRSVVPGLDDFHEPVFEKLVTAHRRAVPDLGPFALRYPTAGSEEGIREYLTLLQTKGVERIYVWKGDYEGYREVARRAASRRSKLTSTPTPLCSNRAIGSSPTRRPAAA
jgi:hypothetical protein